MASKPNKFRKKRPQGIRESGLQVVIKTDCEDSVDNKTQKDERTSKEGNAGLEAVKDLFYQLTLKVLQDEQKQNKSNLLSSVNGYSEGTRDYRNTKKAA